MRDIKYLTEDQATLSYEGEDGRIIVLDRGSVAFDAIEALGPAHYAPPPPTVEDYRAAVRDHINATAQARGYDDAVSLAVHATSTKPIWAAEAAAFIRWRDDVWDRVFAMWANPPDPPPSPAGLVALLPEITWPPG